MIKKTRNSAKYALMSQVSIFFVMMFSSLLMRKKIILLSVFWAGIVAIVPIIVFASVHFYYRGARQAKQIVNGFYKGEALKMMTTAVLFGFVFSQFHLEPRVFFGAYILMITVPWFIELGARD